MKYAFRLVCSPGSSFLTKDERRELLTAVVKEVEREKLTDQAVIYDDAARGLKIVVKFAEREVHIMTVKEAKEIGLPDKPDRGPAETNTKPALQIICSETAAAALTKSECHDIVQRVLPMAEQKDRGVHEGLTFAFDMHGAEWKVVVDLQQSWVKVLRKDEFEKGMAEELNRN